MFLLGGIGILLAWFLSGKYFIESPRWLAGKGQIAGAESQLREVEQQIEREKRIRLPPLTLNQSNSKVKVIKVPSGSCLKGNVTTYISRDYCFNCNEHFALYHHRMDTDHIC